MLILKSSNGGYLLGRLSICRSNPVANGWYHFGNKDDWEVAFKVHGE